MDLYHPSRIFEAEEEPTHVKRIGEVALYRALVLPRARIFALLGFLAEVHVVGTHEEPLHPAVSELDAGKVIRAAFRNGKEARLSAR